MCVVMVHYYNSYRMKASNYSSFVFRCFLDLGRGNFLFLGPIINGDLTSSNRTTPLYTEVMEAISRITRNNRATD